MSTLTAPTLTQVLYDDRLTNDQRLVISKVHADIKSASIVSGNRLFLYMRSGKVYRVDPSGTTWKVA